MIPLKSVVWGLIFMLMLFNQAFAQQSPEEQAKILSKEAFQAFQNNDFDTALSKYEQALEFLKHPSIMVNLATVYEHLEQNAKAFSICKEALTSELLTPAIQKVADDCVARIEPKLNEIQATIDSRPSKANIKIDGEDMGKTPWQGVLKPGRRQIDFDLDGYSPVSKSVSPTAGSRVDLKVTLHPLGLGTLMTIRSNPENANIMLDGSFIGQTPLNSYQAAAGAHQLEIYLAGYLRETRAIMLREGEPFQEKFYLQPERGNIASKTAWPAWGFLGAGVLTAGFGGFFGYQALDARNQADSLARTDGTEAGRYAYRDQVNQMHANQNASDILWISSGVLITTGLIWWLLN